MSTDGPAPLAVRVTHILEESMALERLATALGPLAGALTSRPDVRGVLLGRPAGHALHPMLTDLPIGVWASASLLDLIGGAGTRPAARRLVGLGILSALPTAATGLAEWTHTDVRSGRVGAAHAAGNALALALYASSWVARHREQHGRGTALALVGAAVVSASSFLGGHLSLARNVASRNTAFADSLPADALAQGRGEAMLT